MPAWWGKKSHKNSKDQQTTKNKEKARSFDDTLIIPRTQTKDIFIFNCSPSTSSPAVVATSSSLDSNFDIKRGHPLPRPSVSSAPSLIQDHNGIVASGSGSMCGSSVSSSASSDDPNPDFGFSNIYRGHTPTAGSPKARSPKAVSPKARSPGPGSRGPTVTTSPLHPRLSGMSLLESPTGKQEDGGRSPCHPLPLPPGSPTKSSTSSTSARSFAAVENSQFLRPKWKKGKLLGRGTFGHVYLGFNSEGGQMCAIKEVTLLSDDQNSKECLKQLNQEINLLGQLSHPNIVQYHGSDMGEEALSVYLEFVSGGSIHKLLQEYGAFKEPVIQNYTRQILLGLSYLHARNTVHRDIKGANILVGPNGEIKLADFGMAKHITSHSSILSFKGSPYWMAPEVIMNSSGHSLAVDIWSLGCTILEMATGKPPWSQYEGVAAIFKIGNSKDIPDIPEHLSNDAKSFVTLCLQRDPSARPTATQLLDHPFIQNQLTTKVPKMNIVKDIFPSSLDGSHTPTTLDFHFNKTNIASQDGDKGMRLPFTPSRAVKHTRDPTRLNMSLPVSPCSSPLRQQGPAHRSCFLSPPHPAYALLGQSGYGLNNQHPFLSTRQYTNHHPLDQWLDISHPKAETPIRSPRTRPM